MTDVVVTSKWLEERANLNDARVTDLVVTDSNATITIDDEWTAFEGQPGYEPSEGALVVIGIEKNLTLDKGAMAEMIDEVVIDEIDGGRLLTIVFFGQQKWHFKCRDIRWKEMPNC